jgi:hypothetical protein
LSVCLLVCLLLVLIYFDRLVIYDELFKKFQIFSVDEIPTNKKYHNYFQGKFKIKRNKDNILTKEQLEFLNVFKIKNKLYIKFKILYIKFKILK